jgi:hypothetical protein
MFPALAHGCWQSRYYVEDCEGGKDGSLKVRQQSPPSFGEPGGITSIKVDRLMLDLSAESKNFTKPIGNQQITTIRPRLAWLLNQG